MTVFSLFSFLNRKKEASWDRQVVWFPNLNFLCQLTFTNLAEHHAVLGLQTLYFIFTAISNNNAADALLHLLAEATPLTSGVHIMYGNVTKLRKCTSLLWQCLRKMLDDKTEVVRKFYSAFGLTRITVRVRLVKCYYGVRSWAYLSTVCTLKHYKEAKHAIFLCYDRQI
jgi:hypothetical protein